MGIIEEREAALAAAYSKEYHFPDVWKYGEDALSSIERDALVVKAMRSAVNGVRNNFLMIGKILYTCSARYNRFIRLETGHTVDIYTWCEQEFGFKKSTCYSMQSAYETYCIDDRKSAEIKIKPEYVGYNQSQLVEMLPLDDKDRSRVKPEMTVKQIRELKQSLKPPKKAAELPKDEPEQIEIDDGELEADFEERDELLSGRLENEASEDSGSGDELEDTEAASLPTVRIARRELKNVAERQAWVKNYRAWGVFASVRELGLYYYRYEFPNGDRVFVTEQRTEPDQYNKTGITHYWHLCKKSPKEYPHHFKPGGNSMSVITDYLCEKKWCVDIYPTEEGAT